MKLALYRTSWALFALMILLLPLLLFTSCASTSGAGTPVPAALLQKILDDTLPPTFTGHIAASHVNQYFTIEVEADGLKHTDQGWTWAWLRYHRQSHFPLAPGFTWGSTGNITLGSPPATATP